MSRCATAETKHGALSHTVSGPILLCATKRSQENPVQCGAYRRDDMMAVGHHRSWSAGARHAKVKLVLPGGQTLPGGRLQDLHPGVVVPRRRFHRAHVWDTTTPNDPELQTRRSAR